MTQNNDPETRYEVHWYSYQGSDELPEKRTITFRSLARARLFAAHRYKENSQWDNGNEMVSIWDTKTEQVVGF